MPVMSVTAQDARKTGPCAYTCCHVRAHAARQGSSHARPAKHRTDTGTSPSTLRHHPAVRRQGNGQQGDVLESLDACVHHHEDGNIHRGGVPMKACKICHKAFLDTSVKQSRKMCSPECVEENTRRLRDKFNKKNYKGSREIKERVCVDCGIIFTGSSSNCGRKVCLPAQVKRRQFMVKSSTLWKEPDSVRLRDAYENLKPVSEQVNDRFKEAQNLHGKESAVDRMEALLAHGKPSTRHKVMPGRKRKQKA